MQTSARSAAPAFTNPRSRPPTCWPARRPVPQCGAAVHREDGVCSDCGATFCPRCLALTKDEDEQCPGCGLALYFACPDCGEQLLASTPICPSCDRLFARKCPSCGFTDLWGAPLDLPAVPQCLAGGKAADRANAESCRVAEVVIPVQVRCPQCGKRFDPAAGPCPECGQIVCPKCHARLFEDELVCHVLRHRGRHPLSQLPGPTLARHGRMSCVPSISLPAMRRGGGRRRDGVRILWRRSLHWPARAAAPKCRRCAEACPSCGLDLSGRCPKCQRATARWRGHLPGVRPIRSAPSAARP